MKKQSINAIMIFTLLITLLISFCACNLDGLTTDGHQNAIQSNNNREAIAPTYAHDFNHSCGDDSEYADPPAMLIFNNLQEYHEFRKSVELNDGSFNAFIENKSYDMNGIRTKENVKLICETIEDVSFPNHSKLQFSQMIIYPERNTFEISFEDVNSAKYSFLVYLDSKDNMKQYTVNNKQSKESIAIKSDAISEIYDVSDTNNIEAYYTVIGGYAVLFRAFNSTPANALDILENADFAPMTQ